MPVAGPTIPLFALVSRLLLTISMWHAPIPWGHAHLGESIGLSEHLASHHREDPVSANLGFHWHLEFPDWGHPCPIEPGSDSCPVTVLSFDSAVVSMDHTDSVSSCVALCAFATVPPFRPDLLARPRHSRGYLGTYTPNHSSQQLLCRLRC